VAGVRLTAPRRLADLTQSRDRLRLQV